MPTVWVRHGADSTTGSESRLKLYLVHMLAAAFPQVRKIVPTR